MLAMNFADISGNVAEMERLMVDSHYVAEQKMDGMRLVATHRDGEIHWETRDGSPIGFSAAKLRLPALAEALLLMNWPADRPTTLDGEMMIADGSYRVFDLVRHTDPYINRRAALAAIIQPSDLISIVEMACGERDKRALLARVVEGGGEGIMLKDLRAFYEEGARAKHAVKWKLTYTVDVVVLTVNRPDAKHGSARLGAYNDEGVLVPIGATSLIGKPVVEVGDVVELVILNWTGASVYQPRLIRLRPDKPATECTFEQFKHYSRVVM